MSRITAVALAALVTMATLSLAVVGGAAAATQPSESNAAASTDAESSAYAGAHVAFDTSATSLVDYSVDGEPVFENVSVASQSDYHGQTGVDGSVALSAVIDVPGIGLELDTQTETRAQVESEGSASIAAHDTDRGILTVDAGGDEQYVELELAGESNADASENGDRVIVDTDDRTGAIVVAGDGEVTVNEDGDVTADLEGDSTLVFRSYEDGERDDDAEEQESLIAQGTATAEVYADERDGERLADVATYGHDVAVDTTTEAEDRLEMTVERAESEGTVVIATVSEAALEAAGSADDLAVTVDGEVAAEASSYSELEGGIGEEPRYMVTQSADAEGAVDVLVCIDHFSEREVAVQRADDAEDTDDGLPGFGVGVALIAVLVAIAARATQ